jgi:nucleoside triphosphate diphosphatase
MTGIDNPLDPSLAPFDRLLAIMARLRDKARGCPWDLAQDFRSIVPHTIEEAYEVADAIEQGDMPGLVGELGDLLFQVAFYSQMAKEAGLFDFADVLTALNTKMIERHPHVFGTVAIGSAAAQTVAWEQKKAEERAQRAAASGATASALDGVIQALPAMSRAEKLQKRAARVGFDWPDSGQVLDKIVEELGEVRQEIAGKGTAERLGDEVGDLLFACVNLARHLQVDPEAALRQANRKFERRFRRVEELAAATGQAMETIPLEKLEEFWQAAKAEERAG